MKLLKERLPLSISLALMLTGGAISAAAQPASGTPINPDLNESSANPRLVRITQAGAKGTILASVAPGRNLQEYR